MNDNKNSFNVLDSIKNHIETLQPLLPRQATVYIGEYPIKVLLKQPYLDRTGQTLQVLVGKSSDEVYNWVPKGFDPNLVLGFEDANVETHFWYNVLPFVSQDQTLIEGLKKKPIEKLRSSIIVASVWDGIGSALLPTLISKFKSSNINSLSIALLPSKIQPSDAYFNTLATMGLCAENDAATVLLMDRDMLESYEGVDRAGLLIKGNVVANYLVNLFLSKETLVEEISEQARTFNNKMYTTLLAAGASIKIYGSIENMLTATLLKPLLNFDLSTVSLLYVLIRMPSSLKDKLPRAKIELAVARWFKEKANLKSIYITEPVYAEDSSDRIDLVLFVGGFDTAEMFLDYEKRAKSLVSRATQKGFVDKKQWQEMMKNLGIKKDEEVPS
ncbi:MAG TPA: hypothetical protein VK536_01370 [Candidatus Limnocylindrales bacterium]|nr:hypothetical protein [Candidatus Limnocylindrales bacterium]